MSKRSVWLPWLICCIGALFYCYEYFLRILPSVMVTDLLQIFRINGVQFGNLVAFYYYAYTPMQLPVGILMDRFEPRILLVFAALVCSLGTYLFAQPILLIAQIGRFLVGFGSSFAFVGVLKLAALWLPPSRFALIAGLTTSLGMLGGMVGNIALAKLVMIFGVSHTLHLALIAGVLLTLCLWYVIPHKHTAIQTDREPKLRYAQFFSSVIALFKQPQMWLVGIIGAFLYLSLSAFAEVWGIPYLIRVHGLSTVSASMYISFVFLGWTIGGPLIGWISDRTGNRRLPLIFGAGFGGLCFALALLLGTGLPKFLLGGLLFLFGIFSSAEVLVFPMAFEMNRVSGLSGTALAVMNLLVMLGGVLTQPLIGKLLDLFTGKHIAGNLMIFSTQSFQYALGLIPICFFLAAILLLFVRETFVRERKSIN